MRGVDGTYIAGWDHHLRNNRAEATIRGHRRTVPRAELATGDSGPRVPTEGERTPSLGWKPQQLSLPLTHLSVVRLQALEAGGPQAQ